MSVINVTSPWDGRVVGSVQALTADEVGACIDLAHSAHVAGPPPAHERAEVLERAIDLVQERSEDLALVICDEAGKPLTAARTEVARSVDTLRAAAVEARQLTGSMIPMEASAPGVGHLAYTQRHPVGVVAAITPFNFPLNLSMHKLAPAIAAGCPIVHKPASATPLSARMLHQLLHDAGQPADRLQLVPGGGAAVGDVLVSDERVELLTFTGSSAVGWDLRARAPRKHVVLELGNATPLVVRADADLDAAARAIVAGGFGYAGQSCISVQRVIVHAPIHDDLVDRTVRLARALGVGDPRDPETTVGPLIDAKAAAGVADVIAEAVDAGAHLQLGTGRIEGPNQTLIGPVVLTSVDPQSRIARDELFGPAVAFFSVEDDQQAIALANATPYGLQAGIFTSDLTRALDLTSQFAFGGVVINETPTFRADQMPYGGVKASGNAKEGPRWSVPSMTLEQLVVIGGSFR